MVPPGLSIWTMTARGARGLRQPVERLDAILVAADQALDGDAGDLEPAAGKSRPRSRAAPAAVPTMATTITATAEHAPEGQLAPHAAAIDDQVGIKRHCLVSFCFEPLRSPQR